MFCWLKIFIDNQTWVITGFNTGATACDFSTDLSGRLNSYTPSQAVWTPIVIIFLEWVSAGLSRRGSAQWGGELHPPARRSHRPTFFCICFTFALPLSGRCRHCPTQSCIFDQIAFHRTSTEPMAPVPKAQRTKSSTLN